MIEQYEARLEKISAMMEKILSGKTELHNPGLVLRTLEILQERLMMAIELESELVFVVD